MSTRLMPTNFLLRYNFLALRSASISLRDDKFKHLNAMNSFIVLDYLDVWQTSEKNIVMIIVNGKTRKDIYLSSLEDLCS